MTIDELRGEMGDEFSPAREFSTARDEFRNDRAGMKTHGDELRRISALENPRRPRRRT